MFGGKFYTLDSFYILCYQNIANILTILRLYKLIGRFIMTARKLNFSILYIVFKIYSKNRNYLKTMWLIFKNTYEAFFGLILEVSMST